ncbi:MAG: hypothetical protein AAF797_13305 [Planctomycetota bacterium]
MRDEYEPMRYALPADDPYTPARRGWMPWWGWLLVLIGAVVLLCCGGIVGFVIYAAGGPDIAVYPGSRLPTAYRSSAERLGLVEPGETIRFYYSDALRDVEDGFVLVTEDHVAVHDPEAGMSRVIRFDEIDAARLRQDTSFLFDSSIVLELSDGTEVDFLVSSEQDRDQDFYEAIEPSGPGASGGDGS